ncbi:MAG TPA: hypothetical protein VGE25_00765 [Sediminibacterium sp.]
MKQVSFFLLAVIIAFPAMAHVENGGMLNSQNILESGVGLGAVMAVVTSWSRNRSILWAIFHGICGWLYVVYFALSRAENE